MKKLNNEDVKVGDTVLAYVDVEDVIYHGDTKRYLLVDNFITYVYKEDDWIPYKEDEFNSLSKDSIVMSQRKNGNIEVVKFKNIDYVPEGYIIAYKVITPYTPPRKKVVVNNSVEIHQLILDNDKVYYTLTGDDYVTFDVGCFVEDTGARFCDWDKKEWWIDNEKRH